MRGTSDGGAPGMPLAGQRGGGGPPKVCRPVLDTCRGEILSGVFVVDVLIGDGPTLSTLS